MSRKPTTESAWLRVLLGTTMWTMPFTMAMTITLVGACDKKAAEHGGEGAKVGVQKVAPADPAGAEEPPATKKVVGEELIQHLTRCNDLVESWDKERLNDCFTADVDVRYLDAIPPSEVKGVESVIVLYGAFRNAFHDVELELPLILVNDTKSAVVNRISGKHVNASLGIPPTGKLVSILQAEVADHDAQGRTAWVRGYDDQSTFFHQLGLLESATATDGEKPWPRSIRVVAKGDETERANLNMVKRGLEAVGKRDVAGALSIYTPDASFRYLPEGKPHSGRKEIEANLESYLSASESVALSIRDAWAAGEWVVAEITMKVKLAGDLPGVEGSKGKGWEVNSLELFRVAGGMVTEHWRFANGLKFAADMGFFDPKTLTTE